jgi:hypothetical protein
LKLKVQSIRMIEWPMQTRFPFRYGIASMTELPHLVLYVDVEMGGKIVTGVSADGLPPKWFTKAPDTTFDDDLSVMRQAITRAGAAAMESGWHGCFFRFWQCLYDSQADWAHEKQVAPLLAGFGVSLVERAVLDAVCRAADTTLSLALKSDLSGIQLTDVRSELAGVSVRDVLLSRPLESIEVRHTIGLGDPLTDFDVPENERLHDGLPHTLEHCIREYGLSCFKIKLSGDFDFDHHRLVQLSEIFRSSICAGENVRFTVDGNENFRNLAEFRGQWELHRADPGFRQLVSRGLLFVEQPVHRDTALDGDVAVHLSEWADGPPVIIDESDADLQSLPLALELGYAGVSHKNCKGVVKGLANAALLAVRRTAGLAGILSGEDLVNVGPIALHQDLVMMANLGIRHVERNGHHYFQGLSQFPEHIQQSVFKNHSDLYRLHPAGFVALRVESGRLKCASLLRQPFGVSDVPLFTA